jgi:hypothetical protein
MPSLYNFTRYLRIKSERGNTLRKNFYRTAAGFAGLLCASAVVIAATTFLTVSPTNLQGWQIQVSASPSPTPSVTFVNGPGTPPLGSGSAELRVGPDGNSAAQLRHPGYAGTRLPNPSPAPPAADELSSLSYATYVQQDGSGGQAPYIILQIDTDGDAGIEDLLFFEPAYQSATFCPSNPQPALVTGQWQTWDAFNGCWYSVFGTAGSGPGTNTVSLRTLSAALPTGRIANSSPSGLGGVRIVAGFGAGAWDNFIGNVDAFRIGVGANDTLYNFDPNQSIPTAGPPSTLIISETRFQGPNGLEDEYVEIYNNTDTAHVVSPPDGSSGYALVAADGAVRAVIPFGATIPARGHYLIANSNGYSLSGYPAGPGTTATPDLTFTADIPNSGASGVALFLTSNPANFTVGNRLDAFGFAGAPPLYREGAGFPSVNPNNDEHAFYRTYATGIPKDSGDNQSDFFSVNTAGTPLGAPGPENTTSPVQRTAQVPASLVAPCVPATQNPNRVRDLTSDPANNSTLGTLDIRRRFTNTSGSALTRLRFRIIDITSAPAPSGTADLRARTSTDVTIASPCGGFINLKGTTLEEPPAQPLGGAFNSTLSAGTITLATPLAHGASIDVRFLLGVQQTGNFRFFVIVEALP